MKILFQNNKENFDKETPHYLFRGREKYQVDRGNDGKENAVQ